MNSNIELVTAMHEVIASMNDERAYEEWILEVPDEPDYDDFESIAADRWQLDHVCRLFRELVGRYGRAGWFTGADDMCYGAD